MLHEVFLLKFLIFLALIWGPVLTYRYILPNSKSYLIFYVVSLVLLVFSQVFSIYELSIFWLFFCLFGFLSYLNRAREKVFTLEGLVISIPLVFSVIGALWLFSGLNDLSLLGYNQVWSFYAALHGNFLGWILILSFVLISRVFSDQVKKMYLLVSGSFLLFFLLVAFGINGIPYIKSIGAFGIVALTPVMIGSYVLSLRDQSQKMSFYFSSISFICLCFTLYLAAANEWSFAYPKVFLGVRSMVSLHGLINGAVAMPCLILALVFDRRI